MNNYPNNPYAPYGSQTPPRPPQQKWYKTNAGIIVLLILFFPVGLYLMWRYTQWNSKAKWAITGIFAFLTLVSMITNTSAEHSSQLATPVPTVQATHPAPTSTVMPKPTPTPIPTPTPEPVQQVPQQPSQTLTVTFTGESATVGDANSYVAVHTLPGAALTISVKYCSGRYATSESLKGTQYANAAGDNIWTWDPETTCTGTATAYVTASLNGQSASNSVSFPVS